MHLFISCANQWNSKGDYLLGLNYAGLEATARILKIDLSPLMFTDIQIMEAEMVRIMNERIKSA